jgi:hypothetical protein
LNYRLAEVKKERNAIITLRGALVAKQSSLSSSLDYKVLLIAIHIAVEYCIKCISLQDEFEKIKELIQRLCEVL